MEPWYTRQSPLPNPPPQGEGTAHHSDAPSSVSSVPDLAGANNNSSTRANSYPRRVNSSHSAPSRG